MKHSHFSRGQVSRTLLVLAVVIFILAVGVYSFLTYTGKQRAAQQKVQEEEQSETPKPVYEGQIGDVKFTFQSARDLGSVIRSSSSSGFAQTVTSTERFVKVVIGAQNKGKKDLVFGAWSVGNIIDSGGRSFVAVDNKAYFLLPRPNLCGAILKPEFDPTPCVRIYEVSSASTGLKVEVIALAQQGSAKKQSGILDLKFK